ncbi:hypothetical protein EJ03DRAFT_386221 [Teratosphaeria nubilosa]|uniref:BTB domain-containing protein n=1 Tax=Teratosphaeria nubilosa TaxID=161662 RepID=A0A6G1KTR0_9PEZI|nr:hypothetical protein EJ03DRAFT_386221 [Teratosphaeria nubilosa]
MGPTIEHAAKSKLLSFSDVFTVLAGEDEKPFLLHGSVICNHSSFFRAACNREFKENAERIIRLPEVEPDAFSMYAQWAYSGEIVVVNGAQTPDETNSEVHCDSLAELYLVGDVLGDTLLRNTVVDRIRKNCSRLKRGPSNTCVNLAYSSTPENSALRRLVVDWHAREVASDWLKSSQNMLPLEFYKDLAIAWAEARLSLNQIADWKNAGQCNYHDHDEEVSACDPLQNDKPSLLPPSTLVPVVEVLSSPQFRLRSPRDRSV